MDVTIIIVSYNTKKLTLDCIKSIYKFTKRVSFELIVVDNNSNDGTLHEIKKRYSNKIALIENNINLGYGKANNQGARIAKGRYLLFINSDTFLFSDSISTMIEWMDKKTNYGVTGCKILNKDKTIQPSAGYSPNLLRIFLWSTLLDDIPMISKLFGSYHPQVKPFFDDISKNERKVDWVSGAFFLVKRNVFEKIKGFDEDFFMYVEEVELCHRIQLEGWEIAYNRFTEVIHIGGASGSAGLNIIQELKGLRLYYKKHKNYIESLILNIFIIIGSTVRTLLYLLLGKKKLVIIYAKTIFNI